MATEPCGGFTRLFVDRHDGVRICSGAHQCRTLIRKRLHDEAFRFALDTSKDEMGAAGTRVQVCVEPGAQSGQFSSPATREACKRWSHQFVEAHECGRGIAGKHTHRDTTPFGKAEWPAWPHGYVRELKLSP